jgi:Flp pilus assembly protein TadB
MRKIIFSTALLLTMACNNSNQVGNNTAQNTPSVTTTKTSKFEAVYEQAAREACNCMSKLDSLNTKRNTYKTKGNGDSLMRMIPEMRLNAVSVWKCFETKISGLGALERAKLDEALDALCPTWSNLKRDSIIAPTH